MPIRAIALALIAAAGPLVAEPVPARGGAPLSAIDWLSKDAPRAPGVPPRGTETAKGIITPEITVTPLGVPDAEAAGLFSPDSSGLPADLWSASDTADIAQALERAGSPSLPAMQRLLRALLLTEAQPPATSSDGSSFLLARIDVLIELGALDEVAALVEQAGPRDAQILSRDFDVALLRGAEDEACKRLEAHPELTPSLPARIFCLARAGDWSAAALSLEIGKALGKLDQEEDALLARFLHADFAEDAPAISRPKTATPLKFRLLEAIGEPLPTATLPRAYAYSDLRGLSGWKAQLSAAERLAQAGAIPAGRLASSYRVRDAAASGGVWDRVDAVQALLDALDAGDRSAAIKALPVAWERMSTAGLGGALAAMAGEALADLNLSGTPADLAFRLALLSPAYAEAAEARRISDPEDRLLIGLAQGTPPESPASSPVAKAVVAGFTASPPDAVAGLLDEGRKGEAILASMAEMNAADTPARLTRGIAGLRAAGLETVARRAALELVLLPKTRS
ncbi:hypothetical protein SAMN05421688_0688 [Poseidonocella pacifica]|uniref:Uncharacterized protein n=1 Tax=Poseidonocella pacifica TaxID=871651 RepID=A0A1I0VKC4_9RHOB|nr:hypothetical protein [Poseidonocella pacifica]SFA76350.1 hypothetical protein SAMN05421688_0688 [Poseidonocella pacifica]